MFTAEEISTMQRWQRSADECWEAAARTRGMGLHDRASAYESIARQYEELIEDFGRTIAQAVVSARPGMVA